MYRFVGATSGSLEYGYAIVIHDKHKGGKPIDESAHISLVDMDTNKTVCVTNDKFRRLVEHGSIAGVEIEDEMQVVSAMSSRCALLWNQVTYNGIMTVNTAIFNYRGIADYDNFISYLCNTKHISSFNSFNEACAEHKMLGWKQIADSLKGIHRDGIYFHDMYVSNPSCANLNIIDLYFAMPEAFYIIGDTLMLSIPEQAVHDYSPIYTWKLGYKFLIEVL